MHRAHSRRLVAGAAAALLALGIAGLPAVAQDARLPFVAVGGPQIVGRIDGTKGSSSARSAPSSTRAAGDVTIGSLGCSPSSIAYGDQTTCTYEVQNQTQTATTVDLQATGDAELAVVGADQGAAVTAGTARAEDVPLPPRTSSPIQVNVGSTPAGFTPLSTAGIPATAIADDQLLNVATPAFRWNGVVYDDLGVTDNGYVVVGGGTAGKDSTATPQDVPNAGRPNNVLAPFWTDLDPAAVGATFSLGYVVPGGSPACDRPVWIVAEWQMPEFGTGTVRKTQVWIESEDPECATDTAPAEAVYFTYDHTTMTAAPARPFRIAAEDSTGTVGGMRPAGELPTQNYRVTSSGTAQPAPVVQWQVVGEGRAAGTGTIAATVESSLIPGSATAFTDVEVTGQAAPTVTDDPDDATVTAGQQAVFTAAATGAGSVAWEVSTDSGGSWDPVPGADATTLAFTAGGGDDGNQYRAVFSNPTGTASTPTDPATLTVEKISTSVAVVPSPAAPTAGQSVTFTATVSPGAATGTVQFSVDGDPLGGPVAVAGGTATSPSTSSLAPGDHSVSAVYSGDVDHAGSTGTGGVSVDKIATTTGVTLAPAAPFVGEDVTFTATVSPSSAPGTVQFTVDGTPLGGPVTVTGGTATSSALSGLERGAHTVVAAYSGDATRAMSTSGPVSFTVARRGTDTAVTVAPPTPTRGDDVTFTATVAPVPAGGTVQFSVDGTPIGDAVAVVGGTATSAPVDLPAGPHTVTAAYSGGDAHLPSTSAAVPFTVARRSSTTTVVAIRPAIAAEGDDVTVDVAVAPAPLGGSVQMAVDGTDVGAPITLDGAGEATATLTGLDEGDHTVTATFSGDADLLGSSTDAALTVHSPSEAFVRRAYGILLGRPSDPAGTAHWTALIDGGTSRESVLTRIARTTEGRAHLVDVAYEQVLGRSADPDGRTYWTRRLQEGMSAEDLLATLLASSESYQHSGGHPEGVALTLYRVYLGRVASTADLAYWRIRIADAATPGGRRLVALSFGRTVEATSVAIRRALVTACGGPGATPEQLDVLADRWVASGRDPLLLAGSALALVCPPGA